MNTDFKVLFINEERVESVGNFHDADDFHVYCVLEYINKHYGDDKRLNRLNSKQSVTEIGRFLSIMTDTILVFNVSGINSSSNSEAFVLFPRNKISDGLAKRLLEQAPLLSQFKMLEIEKSFVVKFDGNSYLDGCSIHSHMKNTVDKLIDCIEKSNAMTDDLEKGKQI